MGFLIIYGLLAVVVALLCTLLLSMPVFDRLMADGVENSITENPITYYFSTFILSFIVAPIVAIFVLPSFDRINEFRDALYTELQKA